MLKNELWYIQSLTLLVLLWKRKIKYSLFLTLKNIVHLCQGSRTHGLWMTCNRQEHFVWPVISYFLAT